MNSNIAKKNAAKKACEFVKSGMVLGLGTGSTVDYAMKRIGTMINEGEITDIIGIPTSIRTEKKATELGIPLSNLNEHSDIDLDIDGADQVDPYWNLIKGGGGALTREKIVAFSSKEFYVICDSSKIVEKVTFPIPTEFIEFSLKRVYQELKSLGFDPVLRENFITDNGNLIFDSKYEEVDNVKELESLINNIPGVLENGIFSKKKPDKVFVGYGDGLVKELRKR